MSEKCQQMIDQSIELHLAFQEEAQKVLTTLGSGIIDSSQIVEFARKILEKNSRIVSIEEELVLELATIDNPEEHPALKEKNKQRTEIMVTNDQLCQKVAEVAQEAMSVISIDMQQTRTSQAAMSGYKMNLSAH